MRPDDIPSDRLRIPPQAIDAEQAILGAILMDNDAAGRLSGLSAEHFYSHENRAIFATLKAIIDACKPADVVTAHVAGGHDLGVLNALAQCVATSRNVDRYAAIVRDKALLRAIIAGADEVSSLAFQGGSAADLADKAASMMAGLQRQTISKAPRSIAQIAAQRMDHYEALERGEILPGWPTGIAGLDRLLTGGLRPGGLYILAARPKIGKSSFALSIADCIARAGRPVLFCSQEMPDTEVADRAVVQAGRVDYSALMSGKLERDGWSKAADALEDLSSMPLYVDDQPALTLNDIRAKARTVKGLKLLIVDYLQLCAGDDAAANRNTQIEGLTRGLKALAKTEGYAVLALSQLNRKVEERASKRPNLGDLRDSGAIEQDADAVIFLWPFREFPREGRRIIGCSVEANRQGQTGAVALDFVGSIQRWAESSADLNEAPQQAKRSAGSFE